MWHIILEYGIGLVGVVAWPSSELVSLYLAMGALELAASEAESGG